MNTDELQALINALKDVRDASDWSGKFTKDIREATREYRFTRINAPLYEAIGKLDAELRKRNRKRQKRRGQAAEYRPPYSDKRPLTRGLRSRIKTQFNRG